MKLGLLGGYGGRVVHLPMDRIRHAEALGYESVWTSEAYGADAVSPAAWILAQTERIRVGTAIMQMSARTPAMTAMTTMTLAQLSGGRFMLGLGASGPQVVEGWHGVAYGKPVTRLKEYVAIVRKILAREESVVFDGDQYQLPFSGPGATGLGKPLKSILHCAEHVPIYAASITPRGVRAAAEVADGFFPIWMDPEKYSVFEQPVREGLEASGRTAAEFDFAPFVTVVMGDSVEECMRPIRGTMALYIGGMGARGRNFYNDYAKALGFGEAAVRIQDLYLSDRRDEAMAAVPAELIDACHLVGPADRIRERLQRWSGTNVSTLMIGGGSNEALTLIAEEML
ncbi:MAG: LLM class F420-dependent oxidoreductase [Gammaproteobacteria bacterium]|nr:LLM class F420-dependent oxidoreductase [Gammaproteobacteria bacterium]